MRQGWGRREGEGLLMATTGARRDPYAGYQFRVEVEGLQAGGFSEVSGLEAQVDVLSYREGGENQFEHKLPGPASYPSNLTLRHGLADPDVLWDWLVEVSVGIVVRRNVTVSLLAPAGDPLMVWDLRAAFPVRWSGPSFGAASSAIALETVELAHHGITRAKGLSVISVAQALGGPRRL
jgi:phage tail-like protein